MCYIYILFSIYTYSIYLYEVNYKQKSIYSNIHKISVRFIDYGSDQSEIRDKKLLAACGYLV